MNKEMINELLEKLKQCDDFHNRCDFLMEHSEITYMLDYITNLQQENEKLKEVIDKLSSQIKLYGKYNGEKCTRGFSMMTADFNKLLDILKEVNK